MGGVGARPYTKNAQSEYIQYNRAKYGFAPTLLLPAILLLPL